MAYIATNEIADLLTRWNLALQSLDPDKVVALYAKNAVLVPTCSNEIRKTPSAIREYFSHFLKKKPRVQVIARNIRKFDTLAIDSGLYQFDLTSDGTDRLLLCRYTFVYQKNGQDWEILEHHSSVMPE